MNRKAEALLLTALAAAFGSYVLLRAWLLPVTVDESTTVIKHVTRDVLDTLMFISEANPNNHILNTLAIKTFGGMFGWHPLVVRLPVLIGAGLYLWAGIHLSRKISNQSWVRLYALTLLFGNPFMLEFFSMARGYGLAAGLMLAALWQAWRFLEENQRKHLFGASVYAGLSVYANFTLLVFFAPFCVLLLLSAWQSNPLRADFWKKTKPALITLFVFIALWIEPLRQLTRDPEIQHWNALGSIVKSVELSVKAATMNHAYLGEETADIISRLMLIASVLMGMAAAVRWWREGWRFASDPRLFIAAVLPAVLTTNTIQVYLTKTPFLEPRMALFYWSLFALQTGVAVSWLWQYRKYLAWMIMAPSLLFATYNLGSCVNLNRSYEWWFDRGTYQVLDYLKEVYTSEGRTEPITLDAHHVMLNSFVFHLERDPRGYNKYVQLAPWHGLRPAGRDYEFYYTISPDEIKDILEEYETIKPVPDRVYILLRKKR